jgi:NAD(P)-dependent dehydrogenase (short-subunit alcohol dehydrogenase family)
VKLKDKVAIVIGAASPRGMGCATALKLAEEGADLVITDLASQIERLKKSLKRFGVKVLNL